MDIDDKFRTWTTDEIDWFDSVLRRIGNISDIKPRPLMSEEFQIS